MTNLFSVIGEHRDDPDRLLLLGEDGSLYALYAPDREPTPIEPTDEWRVDNDTGREDDRSHAPSHGHGPF